MSTTPAQSANRSASGPATTVARPDRLYRALAFAEMVTWTLLLLGMAAKYGLGLDAATLVTGSVHGFVFLAYALVTVLVAIDQRWSWRDLATGLASAVVPYATVPFERSAQRRGLLGPQWRLRSATTAPGPTTPQEAVAPHGPRAVVERITAAALRRPALAALVALAAIVVVFAGLLAAGPPTQWFT